MLRPPRTQRNALTNPNPPSSLCVLCASVTLWPQFVFVLLRAFVSFVFTSSSSTVGGLKPPTHKPPENDPKQTAPISGLNTRTLHPPTKIRRHKHIIHPRRRMRRRKTRPKLPRRVMQRMRIHIPPLQNRPHRLPRHLPPLLRNPLLRRLPQLTHIHPLPRMIRIKIPRQNMRPPPKQLPNPKHPRQLLQPLLLIRQPLPRMQMHPHNRQPPIFLLLATCFLLPPNLHNHMTSTLCKPPIQRAA